MENVLYISGKKLQVLLRFVFSIPYDTPFCRDILLSRVKLPVANLWTMICFLSGNEVRYEYYDVRLKMTISLQKLGRWVLTSLQAHILL